MRNLWMRLFVLVLLSAAVVLLIPYVVAHANAPEQSGPPQIPHAKEGRTDCLSCHQQGVNGAPKYPTDHAGRTNDICVACHAFKAIAPAAATTPPRPRHLLPAPRLRPAA